VLPDVVQDGHPAPGGYLADGIEQRIVGSPAGGELDPDHAGIEAAPQLGIRVGGKVRIYNAIAPNPSGIRPLETEQEIVAVLRVGRGGEVDRGGETPATENRRYVHRNPDAVPGPQTAGIPLLPVGARRTVVQEVRVDVDEHPVLSLLLVGLRVELVLELVRIERAFELGVAPHQDLIGSLHDQGQVRLLNDFLFQNAVFVVYIVQVIDGRLPGRHVMLLQIWRRNHPISKTG
jgi:hypothetical protein